MKLIQAAVAFLQSTVLLKLKSDAIPFTFAADAASAGKLVGQQV